MILEIEKIFDYECSNFKNSKIILKETIILTQKIFDFYKEIEKISNIKSLDLKDEDFKHKLLILNFVSSCQYNFMIGILSILKGHINDSYYFNRKAIECCTFAQRINKSPENSDYWLNAPDDYTKYKKRFEKLFDLSNPIFSELFNRYNTCCKLTHPSIYSITNHFEKNGKEINFKYFQVDNTNIEMLVTVFLWTINTHVYIIKVFIEIFKNECKENAFHDLWNLFVKELKSGGFKLNGI